MVFMDGNEVSSSRRGMVLINSAVANVGLTCTASPEAPSTSASAIIAGNPVYPSYGVSDGGLDVSLTRTNAMEPSDLNSDGLSMHVDSSVTCVGDVYNLVIIDVSIYLRMEVD